MKKPLIIGITGGTGSGKTTVAEEIVKTIGEDNILFIEQDSYYKDQSHLSYEERVNTNYDHPDAIDHELMISQVKDLLSGKAIEMPIYNFKTHTRKQETKLIEPKEIIVLEGILILFKEEIRDFLDIKIYVDTDPDVRVIRRILRDLKERERSLDSIIVQYMGFVRPAHLQFVEPTKKYADIIIPDGGHNKVAIDIVVAKVNEIIKK